MATALVGPNGAGPGNNTIYLRNITKNGVKVIPDATNVRMTADIYFLAIGV